MNPAIVPAPQLSRSPFEDRPRRVLIVDDNEVDQELTVELLRRAWPLERSSLIVDQTGDGFEALRRLRATKYALVLLDWNMPGVSGADVLRVLRTWTAHPPAIVLSGVPPERLRSELGGTGIASLDKNTLTPAALRREVLITFGLAGPWPTGLPSDEGRERAVS